MKIELQDVTDVKKTMTIEVPAEMVQHEREHVLRGYRQKAQIPGFREGKAPMSVVKSRFAKEVREEVRERVLSKAYSEAAKEKGLRPIADPILDEVNDDNDDQFSFKTTFEILPEIKLGNYQGLEVKERKPGVDDAEIEKTLTDIQQSRTQMVVEEGRKAIVGDVIVVDIKGEPSEGEPFNRERMQIEIGQTDNLPAFNEKLEGVTAGDDKSFSVDYPKEYPAEELAGQTVAYEMHVHEVKRREVPEIDDEFAKDLGDFDDLAALKARIREDLEMRQKHEIEGETRNALMEQLLEAHPIALPEVMVEHEIRNRLEDLARNLMGQGMDLENAGLDWKEIREKQEEPARKSVHARLVLDAVAKAEKIEVNPTEFEERVQRDAAQMGQTPADVMAHLDQGPGRQVVIDQILREKSLDLVKASANIQSEE